MKVNTDNLNAAEKKLLLNKTAASYMEACRKSKIKSGRKAQVTKIWLQKYNKTVEDINYARNRNDYWKKKKMAGSQERNKARALENDFSDGKRKIWKLKDIERLYKNNHKMDRELAKMFKVSIASIQARRRGLRMAEQVLVIEGAKRISEPKLIAMALKSEKYLQRRIQGLVK